MFTNKHVVIALIVAPILSILAWFAVGNLIGEKPAAAQAGNNYPLVERSNCRYPSGQCELENEDFSLTFRISEQGELTAASQHPLDGIRIALVTPGQSESAGQVMQRVDGDELQWTLSLGELPDAETRIRVAAGAQGSIWFGEIATRFAQPAEQPIPNPR